MKRARFNGNITVTKALVWFLCLLLVGYSGTMPAAIGAEMNKPPAPPAPAKPKSIKHAPKSVRLFKPTLKLSANPTDLEVMAARVFLEQLVPMHGPAVTGENAALSRALLAYRAKKNPEDVSDLTGFVTKYPKSRWRAALELNLGSKRFETGYLTDAMTAWQSAWTLSKNEPRFPQKLVGDTAIAQLILIEARLGRKAELTQHLSEVSKRPMAGANEGIIRQAREGLSCMNHHPEIAFKCGPFALNSILNAKTRKTSSRHPLLVKAKSSEKGTNLAQLQDLAKQVGLNYQPAKRVPGATIIVPSVVSWKAQHFGAITAFSHGKYRVQDGTFGEAGNLWLSKQAIDSQSSGYFLVPAGTLPAGWTAVSSAEAANIWGKGDATVRDGSMTNNQPKENPAGSCPAGGMAQMLAYSMNAAVNVVDVPLSYSPPVGPNISFRINYNFGEGHQTLSTSNLSDDWSLNWVSYMTVDASKNATVNVRGGGYEIYNYTLLDNVNNPYPPNMTSQAILTVVGDGSYQRQLPDGTVELFNQADTAGHIFMTQVTDPQGNSVFIQYNSNFRVDTITDSLGQASTLTYNSNTFPGAPYFEIAGITDPFGRSCAFGWDTEPISGVDRLRSSSDVIGLKSQFDYDIGSTFLSKLETPYGNTSVSLYDTVTDPSGNTGIGLKFVLPDGTTAVIENWINELCDTFYWDREATMLYPNDPANLDHTHCKTTQFMISGLMAPIVEEPVIEYIKPALENKTEFTVAGQGDDGTHKIVGPSDLPIQIQRVISGMTTQTWNYSYNSLGHVTQAIDPVGRTFGYSYAANNIDLLEKRQTQSGANDLLGKWEYNNNKHLPNVYIDGSGQKTQYSYNSFGELQTLTDASSNVWTLTYDTNGYLTQIQGPLAGSSDITTLSYDGYGRLYQVTDSEGYTLTYSYDNANRLTQVTYPDGTNDQTVYNRLDAVMMKDRIGRWTTDTYDSLDELVSDVDPLGRKTQYAWCACGSLATLTDPRGNVTTWQHDLEGRVTNKVYADSSQYQYSYDNVGRLNTRTDALNQVTTYSYNLDNTLNQVAYSATVNPTSNVAMTYDPSYPRLSTITNGWGTITYSYNPYITDPFAAPTTGGGMLASVTNNVIPNSGITYSYDALGRTTNRSINGASNSITWSYDAMSRITQEVNALGTFGYSYVDDAPGSSKGTTRLSSISYPNGQQTNFTWYGNIGDQRLQGISNLAPSNVPRSQFNYAYNPAGEIVKWGQQNASLSPQVYNLGYDLAGQLTSAQSATGGAPGQYSNQYYYNYDPAANRTAQQTSLTQTARIGGTVTAGDTVTITMVVS